MPLEKNFLRVTVTFFKFRPKATEGVWAQTETIQLLELF
jgi:hypothetical protein